MGKWNYLARAYAIKEYAYLRVTEAENVDTRDDATANKIESVADDLRDVLEMAEDNEDFKTVKQCKKWYEDFFNKK